MVRISAKEQGEFQKTQSLPMTRSFFPLSSDSLKSPVVTNSRNPVGWHTHLEELKKAY